MARYVPTAVPTTQDISQLERWLREELERIQQSTDDIYTDAQDQAIDGGDASGN